jgi:hypothetical protein
MLSPRRFLALGLSTLLVLTALLAPPALAQTATSAATGTPTATRTPAPTSTATATLTMRQGQLLLAQAFLDGGDFAAAAKLFAALAEQNPGDPTAVPGLKAALHAQATATAAASAARPTPAPPSPTAVPAFGTTLSGQLRDLISTGLAGLVLVLLVYVLAKGIRRALVWAQEQWFTHVVAWLTGKSALPPILVGTFTDATGITGFQGAAIAAQALTEQLVVTGGSVPKWDATVEPAPSLELSGMSWIKVLWNWLLPAPRGYKVNGVLMQYPANTFRLTVERVELTSNSVDASHTFEDTGSLPQEAFRRMIELVAIWLRNPQDLEAELAAQQRQAAATAKAGVPAAQANQATQQAFAQVLQNLREAHQLAGQGVTNYPLARGKLQQAEQLLSGLQASIALRKDLADAIQDLRKTVGG